MKVARPYVPLAVRIIVAEGQLVERGIWKEWERIVLALAAPPPMRERLKQALYMLFGPQDVELHHRPALINRPWSKRRRDYDPPANSPTHLVYLIKDEEHRIETYVRGVGAQRSDVAQRRYLKNVAKNRTKRSKARPNRKARPIPKRVNPWPKGRTMRRRP